MFHSLDERRGYGAQGFVVVSKAGSQVLGGIASIEWPDGSNGLWQSQGRGYLDQ